MGLSLASAALRAEDAPSAASAAATETSGAEAEAPPRGPDTPLADLPEPPGLALPDPRAADLEGLDHLLEKISSPDPVLRQRAVRELVEATPQMTAALHYRLESIADKADKQGMKDLLERIRRKGRDAVRDQMRRTGEKGKVDTPDYLEMVVEYAEPKNSEWRDLISVLAISRMLTEIGTTQAARSLVHVYVRFGEFLRVDTQLQLESLGDRGLAALIEARRHPAHKIAAWAERQLDLTGRAIPSEAVQMKDQRALADILRAFGRIRDPDAARIIISFANSERTQVRTAARQAVVLLGDVANWQLRDSYENTTGKRAKREWTWKRTARELFTEYDRLRLAEVFELFEQGQAAQKEGELDVMRDKFDRVLAVNPLFERRDEMADGFLAYAESKKDSDRDSAIEALRRAERVTTDENKASRFRSFRFALEARQLLDRGLADQGLIDKALSLDPQNELARQTLEEGASGGRPTVSRGSRYLAAGIIASVALLGALGILFVGARRRRSAQVRPDTPPDDDARAEHPTPSREPGDRTEPSEDTIEDASPGKSDETTEQQSPPDESSTVSQRS